MLALERLSTIFAQVEIIDSDTPPRVRIIVSPLMVQNAATPPGVVQPAVTHVTVPNSHRRLLTTPCRAVAHATPHPMARRSTTQQNLSSDMLAETVQQVNHVFCLPTGPAIKKQKAPPRMH
jgi:hypothetical protein